MKQEAQKDIDYDEAVRKGKMIIAEMSSKQWALGDLAAEVTKVYNENRLEQFAQDISFPGAACTLGRYRDVCRAFPKNRVRPRFFASAQILATHDDRFAIVEHNPAISKAEAREIMRQWRAEHPDEDQPDVEQAEEDDPIAEEDDTAPTSQTNRSTPAKARGARTTGKEQENEWSADNRAWERELDVTLNDLSRLFAFRKRCTAQHWQGLAKDVDPSLGARVRNVCEEGLEVADALDEPLKKEADALIETGRIKTTPARRASRPVRPSV